MQLDVDEGYGVTDALEYENCDYFDKRMKLQNYCESKLMKQREDGGPLAAIRAQKLAKFRKRG